MVLYTPLDYHDVYQVNGIEYEWMMYKGRMVQSRVDETGQHRIVQLVSTDPTDYLDAAFSPGTLLPNEVTPNQP